MICKYCNTERKESEFQKANVIKNKVYYRKKCTPCKIKDQNLRLSLNKNFIRDYKKKQSCIKCGINDYRVLQFHHNNALDKEESISQGMMNGWSQEKLINEIKKCSILCANCHSIEHFKE
jgi:hypothetical protein